MSDNFLAGILVGLLVGGLVGSLAVAVVAAGSERRSPRARKPSRLNERGSFLAAGVVWALFQFCAST